MDTKDTLQDSWADSMTVQGGVVVGDDLAEGDLVWCGTCAAMRMAEYLDAVADEFGQEGFICSACACWLEDPAD